MIYFDLYCFLSEAHELHDWCSYSLGNLKGHDNETDFAFNFVKSASAKVFYRGVNAFVILALNSRRFS